MEKRFSNMLEDGCLEATFADTADKKAKDKRGLIFSHTLSAKMC